jgi:hypothetical protein
MEDSEPLDLVDIAVLLLYEWTTLDPRFQHTKLVEVAFPGQKVHSKPGLPAGDDTVSKRTWIILKSKEGSQDNHDLSTNMVDKDIDHGLSDEQLDTVFYQKRAFNFCFPAVALLQQFFDQFPPDTKLRIRLGPVNKQPGESCVTNISHRTTVVTRFIQPKFQTWIGVFGTTHPYFHGTVNDFVYSGIKQDMRHSVMLFKRLEDETYEFALDLASMQFGSVGRGPGEKGKMPFALDSMDQLNARNARLASDSESLKISERADYKDYDQPGLNALPSLAALGDIARRVKERWENRDKEKWCGYCGAPGPKSKCSGCLEVWFCGKGHQRMAWSFHKGYCRKD